MKPVSLFQDPNLHSDSDKEILPMTNFQSQLLEKLLETPIDTPAKLKQFSDNCMLDNRYAGVTIFENVEPQMDSENVQKVGNYNPSVDIDIDNSSCTSKTNQDENHKARVETEHIETVSSLKNLQVRTTRKSRHVNENEWNERINELKRQYGKQYLGKKELDFTWNYSVRKSAKN